MKAGIEMQAKAERTEVTLCLAEMDKGSWVVFELPEFTCLKDGRDLWVKLAAASPVMQIVRPTDLQASITASR